MGIINQLITGGHNLVGHPKLLVFCWARFETTNRYDVSQKMEIQDVLHLGDHQPGCLFHIGKHLANVVGGWTTPVQKMYASWDD